MAWNEFPSSYRLTSELIPNILFFFLNIREFVFSNDLFLERVNKIYVAP